MRFFNKSTIYNNIFDNQILTSYGGFMLNTAYKLIVNNPIASSCFILMLATKAVEALVCDPTCMHYCMNSYNHLDEFNKWKYDVGVITCRNACCS